jgi:hypothetical protein
MKESHPPPKKKKYEAKCPWLSEQSIRLLDMQCALRRNPFYDRAEARRLDRQIKVSVFKDLKAQTEEAGKVIEAALGKRGNDSQKEA